MSFSANKIKSVDVTAARLKVELLDGRVLSTPLSFFPTLAEAKPRQRSQWELCGAGTGIHWPLLDYDLSVAGLLRGEPEPKEFAAHKRGAYPPHKAGKVGVLAEEAPKRSR